MGWLRERCVAERYAHVGTLERSALLPWGTKPRKHAVAEPDHRALTPSHRKGGHVGLHAALLRISSGSLRPSQSIADSSFSTVLVDGIEYERSLYLYIVASERPARWSSFMHAKVITIV
jgi:hypothetical protein